MFKTKTILLVFLLLLSLSWFTSSGIWKRTNATYFESPKKEHVISEKSFLELKQKAIEAKIFIDSAEYNEQICFLIDMSLPSGQNRFFVYNLQKDTIQNAGLVTHGRCNQYWLEGRKFGNTVGCGCTSLGKYKIGYPYTGRFGLAYKLYGLDKTNDKAFERFVVLHAHGCVPETEVKDDICQSDGCPTLSPGFLQQLKPIIDQSKKPVLLWLFE
jgi:hypothetical protein